MIDFELLLGAYTEIESWILNGRVDFGFLRLPTKAEFETIFLEQDRLLVVLPEYHSLAACEKPELILQRIPHKIIAKELEVPAYRNIGVAMREHRSLSLASKKFLDYLSYRTGN